MNRSRKISGRVNPRRPPAADGDKNETRTLLRFKLRRGRPIIANYRDARGPDIDFKLRQYHTTHHRLVLHLKEKYGDAYPRTPWLRSFDTSKAATLAEANERLYTHREEGFIGTSLKKDEYVCQCFDIDDIIIFYKDCKYKVVKVQDKMFVGKGVLYVNIQAQRPAALSTM
ncbi:hypothetical protein [Muribaculum intestinale]|uniref:hypothetical protein n=1 Tax=Muribaculum intestinale TaxID=1796646 RepID=UPI003F680FAB